MATRRRKKLTFVSYFDEKFKERPALKPVFAALFLIIILVLITGIFKSLTWESKWTYYAITMGTFTGLLVGYSLLTKISDSWRFGTVGAFSGLGLDLAAGVNGESGQQTVNLVNAISSLIGGVVVGLFVKSDSATDGKIEDFAKSITDPLEIGIWTLIAVVGIVFLMNKILTNPLEEG